MVGRPAWYPIGRLYTRGNPGSVVARTTLWTGEKTVEKSERHAKTIETRTTIQSIREDGIVHVLLKENADLALEDAKENHRATEKLIGDSQHVILVDSRPARSITREARVYFSDPEVRKNTLAQAIVIDSGVSRVMGNFFIGLNKPVFPVKLFNTEEEAVPWLKGFIK